MTINPTPAPGMGTKDFLLSLAAAIAGVTGLTLGTNLFVHQTIEKIASTPNSVLRVYGGPPPLELRDIPGVSVQCFSVGPMASDVSDQADAIFASLRDDTGVARNGWTIPAKEISATDGTVQDATGDNAGGNWLVHLITPVAPPGVVGRDDRGFWNVSFNFDVRFQYLPLTN